MSTKKKKKGETIYNIPLKDAFKQPKTKRATKAIKMIKAFLAKKVTGEVRVDKSLSEEIWARGREAPPRSVKVKIVEEDKVIKATLAE